MKNVLLPVFYLPPISWFSVFLDPENEIIFEQYESFPKQTFRNRTNIYGANGKLSLIIPINHNGKREFKDIEISYREDWMNIHWKSIKTAYQSSPYFEFYEDKFKVLYEVKEKYLLDFNLKSIDIIQKILKTEKAQSLNEEYIKNLEEISYREQFSPKIPSVFDMEEYYQTFTDKHGFLKDLSIIDLICNKGPESVTYIKNIK
ncbi:WbqC family protein [Chryseobacterium aquaticum]|uniref:WbqC family protein n=1 Tax=Chryseobacterium aquaticum TaxID=452084 RepID=A0A848N6W6_9FLAO|nr:MULTISPECIES: WbqC family protein [Chryseobacterium]NMR35224.1 WbqC family protein [Chryseobacterium aquaticum]NRQ47339.1 WbqC family protein [Chryseobacterium sp. C-204]